MPAYRAQEGESLAVRLPRSWSSRGVAARLAGVIGLIALAAVLSIAIVISLDAYLPLAALACFFGAIVALIVGGILLVRAVRQVSSWRAVELAVELDRGELAPGETVEVRVQLHGRKRVPNVALNLWSASRRVPLTSLADLGRSDVGTESRAVKLVLPRELPADYELEVIADDMRAEPLVQRFRLVQRS